MAPFSVDQLKDKASSVKSSSSDRFQNVRGKFTSRSSAESSYNHRDLTTKAPPPPPRQSTSFEEEGAQVDVPPPPSRSGPPPPVRRSTRPEARISRHQSRDGPPGGVKWSSLSHNDKAVFFGWLDEFFGVQRPGPSAGPVEQSPSPARLNNMDGGHRREDTLKMSHPPHSEHGSAAEDFCVFFSPATRWDEPWFSSEQPTPPPVEQFTDCMRTHSIQWLGDTRTLSGGVLFSDLSACWYTVEWSERISRDPNKARRSVAFMPRPDALSQEELVAAHETYGETVASFAEGYEGTGQWCARGECWDLANEALKAFEQWDYVPKPLPCVGKTLGHLIFEGKAWGKNAQAGRWRGGDDRIRRGDIVQWNTVTITERNSKFTLGQPDHTAIIVSDQRPLRTPLNDEPLRPADLGSLEVVEQSVHSPPSRKVYQLSGMEAGEVWIYRPISMEGYLKFVFSGERPEGLGDA